MAYRMGFCPSCDCQIMVRDTKGMWRPKPDVYAQAYLSFENGQKVKTIICKKCLSEVDNQKLIDSIVHEKSKASSPKVINYIKGLGSPLSVEESK